MSAPTVRPSSMGAYINSMGWLDERVVAAGELRQGRGLAQILLPRRSKLLPRHFALAVTESRVVAFKAWCGGSGDTYSVGIRPGVRASFARDSVTLTDLRDGSGSRGATMCVDGRCFPVWRPNPTGDWDTDELIALLGGLPPVHVPLEPAWAAFSL